MRRTLLIASLVAVSCSRQPSKKDVYADAWTAFRQGKFAAAQELVDRALKNDHVGSSDDSIRLRFLKAEILLGQWHAKEAQPILDQIQEPAQGVLRLRWLSDQADSAAKLSQQDRAIALLDDLDRASASNPTDDAVFKGRLLRGAILARTGNFDAAEALLAKTAADSARVGDSFNQSAALLNLSLNKIRSERYDESLEFGRPALALAEKVQAGRLAALASANVGVAYAALGDLDRASQFQSQAIQQLRAIGDQRNLAEGMWELGNIYMLRHEPEKAVEPFEQAVQIAGSIDDGEDAADWAGWVASAFAEARQWNEADSWNQKAHGLYRQLRGTGEPLLLMQTAAMISSAQGNVQGAEQTYRQMITSAKETDRYEQLNARMHLGELFASQHRYKEANAQYEEAVTEIETTSSGLIADEYRLTYDDLQNQFFKKYVDLLVSEKQDDQALRVAEYSRARVLAKKLGSRARTIAEVLSSDFRQSAGRKRAVLLSYWLGPQRSFVWVVKSGSIRKYELPGEDKIAPLVLAYEKMIEDLRDPVEAEIPQGKQLSEMLLGPIQSEIAGAKQIVIVPDGVLHTLNLETLPAAGAGRYWIEDVQLSIAPSLTLLSEPVNAEPQNRGKPFLLLIGAPRPGNPDYPALPSADMEIHDIQQIFTGAEMRAETDGSPATFLDSDPGRFSLIHFAAHAEANPASPLDSAVILEKNKQDNGYKLYARDVANQKLSAELVTLSACRSAGAKAYGGEGMVGFTWAFLEAGARAVIAGLWEVGDQSSARLMDQLYQGLKSGAPPPAALREAKLKLLKSGSGYRKPFYWAAYQAYIR